MLLDIIGYRRLYYQCSKENRKQTINIKYGNGSTATKISARELDQGQMF